jgi:hypothetical protein
MAVTIGRLLAGTAATIGPEGEPRIPAATTLRALEERAALLRRLAGSSSGITRRRFEQRLRQTQAHANQLRDTLLAADHAPVADGLDGGMGSAS